MSRGSRLKTVGKFTSYAVNRLSKQYGVSEGQAKAVIRRTLNHAREQGDITDSSSEAIIPVPEELLKEFKIDKKIFLVYGSKKVHTVEHSVERTKITYSS